MSKKKNSKRNQAKEQIDRSSVAGERRHHVEGRGRSIKSMAIMLCILVTVATAVRLVSWKQVFGPDRIHFLVDSDPYYHVLRAQRIVENFPRVQWNDPSINYPYGADILWSPLFDYLIAVPAKILGGTPAAVERVAAVLPVILGIIILTLAGVLGSRILDRRAGWIAAFLLALLPVNVEFTILGRPDQHSMELVASCWIILAFLSASLSRSPTFWGRNGASILLGLGIAIAFWNWQGSAFYLLLIGVFTAMWHIFVPLDNAPADPVRALWMGTLWGAGTLLLSLALFAPQQLKKTIIMGVTSFHLLLVCLTAAFAGLILLVRRLQPAGTGPGRRVIEVLIASFPSAGLALALVPGFRESVTRGLWALGATNTWYATIEEFQPLLFSGWIPLRAEFMHILHHFGLVLLFMPLCILAFVSEWRLRSGQHFQLAFLAYWGGLLFFLTIARSRFSLYLAIPAVLWMALGLESLNGYLHGNSLFRHPVPTYFVLIMGTFIILVPALPYLAPGTVQEAPHIAQSAPLLTRLRGPSSQMPGREAVLATWDLGHAIQYFAAKPVIASPFGIDGGANAMEDSAAFYLASNPEAAEAVITRRHIGFILLSNPSKDAHILSGFAPSTAPKPIRISRDWWKGWSMQINDEFWPLPASRLYFFDGIGLKWAKIPALGAYRLLFETPPTNPGDRIRENQLKLFGIVTGADVSIENAQPSTIVVVTIPIRTNTSRVFTWTTIAQSDAAGRVAVRIPYASGLNGQVRTQTMTAGDGNHTKQFELTEMQVVSGDRIIVNLAPKSAQ